MQEALIFANQFMIYSDACKRGLYRLANFIWNDLLSKPIYAFTKGSLVPVKVADVLPSPMSSIEWYYDSLNNYFYTYSSINNTRNRTPILSAELISDKYQADLTAHFENVYWSGDMEPTHMHYVSAWAVQMGKYVPFDGTYSLKVVKNTCEEITVPLRV